MSFTTRNYEITDMESSLLLGVVRNVTSGRLAGAALELGSPVVNLSGQGNTTDELWPGMLVVAKGIPANTIVLSIDSSTSFTMSQDATADAEGVVIVARGYLPEITTKNINIEHYRDLFDVESEINFRTDYQGEEGGPVKARGSQTMPAALIPTGATAVQGAVEPGGGFSGQGNTVLIARAYADTLQFAVSDAHNHTPPREQTQKVSFVLFVCDDGALVPVPVYPKTLITQEAAAQ